MIQKNYKNEIRGDIYYQICKEIHSSKREPENAQLQSLL